MHCKGFIVYYHKIRLLVVGKGLAEAGELDAEGGALAELAILHIDFAAVIFLDNALHEREPESPATFLGGVARIEHILEVLVRDSLSGVGHVDKHHASGLIVHRHVDFALALHGVDGIFGEILHHPLE